MPDFSGLSVKFPLVNDANSAFYELNQTFPEMIAQNLKNLVLTNPGERMMDPSFGVGILRHLFEPHTDLTYRNIREAIYAQVDNYMPFIKIRRVIFNNRDHPDSDHAYVSIKINYTILPIQTNTTITINVDNN